MLAAHKANFLSLLVLAKKSQCWAYFECSQIPFVTPYIVCTLPFKYFNHLGQWTPLKIYLKIKLLTLPLANLK